MYHFFYINFFILFTAGSYKVKREYKTVFNGVAMKVPANKLSNFESFILLLSYFMVPWTAINLIDYYLLRRGEYNFGMFLM
ncbi:hypothetical protein COE25_01790 [Bacillus sp. AFS031507]|nr:hypothetical protein COE25_01790 [Bacillus sp. AFS031507]